MLKFIAPKPDGNKIIGIGLTRENVDRLIKDNPIMFNLSELGLEGHDVFIMFGEDQQSIVDKLKTADAWPKDVDLPQNEQ